MDGYRFSRLRILCFLLLVFFFYSVLAAMGGSGSLILGVLRDLGGSDGGYGRDSGGAMCVFVWLFLAFASWICIFWDLTLRGVVHLGGREGRGKNRNRID
jgi:hypothetical protein